MRQWIDGDIAFDVGNCRGAGESVSAIDIHRTGAADAFATGTAEGQRCVLLALDLDDGIENHRATTIQIHFVGVDTWVLATVRVVAIDLEVTHIRRTRWGFEDVAVLLDYRVAR